MAYIQSLRAVFDQETSREELQGSFLRPGVRDGRGATVLLQFASLLIMRQIQNTQGYRSGINSANRGLWLLKPTLYRLRLAIKSVEKSFIFHK